MCVDVLLMCVWTCVCECVYSHCDPVKTCSKVQSGRKELNSLSFNLLLSSSFPAYLNTFRLIKQKEEKKKKKMEEKRRRKERRGGLTIDLPPVEQCCLEPEP